MIKKLFNFNKIFQKKIFLSHNKNDFKKKYLNLIQVVQVYMKLEKN